MFNYEINSSGRDCRLLLVAPGPVLHDVSRGVDVLDQGQEEARLPVSLSGPSSTGQEAVDQLGQRASKAQQVGVSGRLLKQQSRSI